VLSRQFVDYGKGEKSGENKGSESEQENAGAKNQVHSGAFRRLPGDRAIRHATRRATTGH